MASKTRLPNKTQWALKDIVGKCGEARGDWRDAMDEAEGKMEPLLLSALANLSNHIAEIESLARDAINGEYNK